MLAQMELIRGFEEKVLELAAQGPVHGAADSAISQEAGAVGSAPSLRPGDQINGSPPAHPQFLAKALSHVAQQGIDPKAELGGDIRLLAKRTHAEILGLSQGFCRGRGESCICRIMQSRHPCHGGRRRTHDRPCRLGAVTGPRRKRRSGATAIGCSRWPRIGPAEDPRRRRDEAAAALRDLCVALMNEVAGESIETAHAKRRIIPALWPRKVSATSARGATCRNSPARGRRRRRASPPRSRKRSSSTRWPMSCTAAWPRMTGSSFRARTCTRSRAAPPAG